MKRNLLKIISVAIILLFVTIGCQKDKNVINVTLGTNNITLEIGEAVILKAIVYPNDAANKVVSWTSSDETVAEVANGFVSAKKVGTTTITVTTEDGNYTAKCEVTVTPKEVGVMINGIRWATRNVDFPGTFAAKPEDAGMFYQWNRKVGWSSTDPMINSEGGTTWYNTNAEGDTWNKTKDPCPAGWRLPTHEEQENLAKVAFQLTTVNDVTGLIFGAGGQTLFLPSSGARHGSNGFVYGVGEEGRYWSSSIRSSTINGTNAYYLGFLISTLSPYGNFNNRAYGFSVRCVSE